MRNIPVRAEQASMRVVPTNGGRLSPSALSGSSFPLATVTVFLANTTTLATIYADNNHTPLANPFTADASGNWSFFAPLGSYDVNFSGTVQPFTIAGLGQNPPAAITISTLLGGGVVSATDFPGTDAGQKIANAIASLPASGGIVDARGLHGEQQINQDVFAGVTGSVRLLLGMASFSVSVKQVLTEDFSSIEGAGGWATIFRATAVLDAVIQVSGNNILLQGFLIDSISLAATGLRILNNNYSRYIDLNIFNSTGIGLDIQNQSQSLQFVTVVAESNATGCRVSLVNAGPLYKVTFINCVFRSNTGNGVILDAFRFAGFLSNIEFLSCGFEANSTGLALTGSPVTVNVYDGHFNGNTVNDINAYKKDGAADGAFSCSQLLVSGTAFYGNVAMAIRAQGLINSTFSNIWMQSYAGPILFDFDNTGVTSIVNFGNLMISPGVNIGTGINISGTFLHQDGVRVINTYSYNSNGEPSYFFYDQNVGLNAAEITSANFSQTRAVTFAADSTTVRAQLLARCVTFPNRGYEWELWSTRDDGTFMRDMLGQGGIVQIPQELIAGTITAGVINTGATLVEPVINGGINPNGSGLKTARVSFLPVASGTETNIFVQWPMAFADANYTVAWSIEETDLGPGLVLSPRGIASKSAGSLFAVIANGTTFASSAGVINVIAIHD